MDAIEPILTHPSLLPSVRAAGRSEPVHRDGHRGGGQGESHHRQTDEDAVEVDIEALDGDEELAAAPPPGLLPALPPHRVDLTADGDAEPPARRIDLTA